MADVSAGLPFGRSALTDGQGGSNLKDSSLAAAVGCRQFNPDGGHDMGAKKMEVYSKA